MDIADYLCQLTGKTTSQLFGGVNPLARIRLDGSVFTVEHWDSSLGVSAPTSAALTAALSAADSMSTLISYAGAKQSMIAGGGTKVTVTGITGGVECSTDPASLVLLQGAATIAASSPSTTFNWVPNSNVPITLSAAQITQMFTGVSAFIQSTFTQLAAVITAINAGTIATKAQVDTPPSPVPAWPVNS